MEEHKYLTLEQIHEEQTKMLKELIRFCDEEKITYYICGGTLLGAIRHKGFIPWDDDIDILMPRPDYEKFHKVVKEKNFHITDNLIVRSFKYNNLLLPFAKVMNTDYKMETHFYENEYDNFLWLDIFPMDGLPKSDRANRSIYRKVRALRRILLLIQVKDEIVENESKKAWMILPKKIIRKILGKEKTVRKIVNKMDKLSLKYDFETSEYVGGIVWGYGPHERLLKNIVGDTKVEFEGLQVNTMSCYDTYLKNLYGNYMKLPPEKDRMCHNIKIHRVGE